MDQLQQYLQNILTEHLHIMHGFTCIIKLTWQHNVADSDLAEITKSLKLATTSTLLCMLVLVTTGHIKMHELHHYNDGMKMLLNHVDMMLKR